MIYDLRTEFAAILAVEPAAVPQGYAAMQRRGDKAGQPLTTFRRGDSRWLVYDGERTQLALKCNNPLQIDSITTHRFQ